jgi:3-deoxy-7-phosphoheptulonate synthase
MVDMSHANSQKDHNKQLLVCESLCHQLADGDRNIIGVMVESNLQSGKQSITDDLSSLTYGQSITDACVDWADTEKILEQLSAAITARRATSP